jgi:histidinol-phosphate aminotransferase
VTAGRQHGGPGAAGPARWDFSTNANAAGPCPHALDALGRVDPTRYPDPGHHALRERLAAWHRVGPERVVVAASASEFIQRITAVAAQRGRGRVHVPRHAYGDYAAAARAHGLLAACDDGHPADTPVLRWCAEPSSPLGQDAPPPANPADCLTVLDAVYAPLRLAGTPGWPAAARDTVFELHSPNKALGLCGVRGAYAIAPAGGAAAVWCAALAAAEPSWPLGAHGVALLEAWASDAARTWLDAQRDILRTWKAALVGLLLELGAEVQPSVTPFICARLPPGVSVPGLREHGIAVRDTSSFGLPGWVRMSAQPPAALGALRAAIAKLKKAGTN